ncbi:hypothetical protein K491DRAFT_672623 [Lophiostoma macrostomum CBS 122681]|uniref:Uncharacterized protein n=1 Tax=Lophiostoma macrostomum CBS 122681 TaxID=1314788 RepID=A0A6A6TRU1_9PLEO|nr:hypothetical protein K491DRAFT_672623 [Lophiostoma macrostomum CBS 122681]
MVMDIAQGRVLYSTEIDSASMLEIGSNTRIDRLRSSDKPSESEYLVPHIIQRGGYSRLNGFAAGYASQSNSHEASTYDMSSWGEYLGSAGSTPSMHRDLARGHCHAPRTRRRLRGLPSLRRRRTRPDTMMAFFEPRVLRCSDRPFTMTVYHVQYLHPRLRLSQWYCCLQQPLGITQVLSSLQGTEASRTRYQYNTLQVTEELLPPVFFCPEALLFCVSMFPMRRKSAITPVLIEHLIVPVKVIAALVLTTVWVLKRVILSVRYSALALLDTPTRY